MHPNSVSFVWLDSKRDILVVSVPMINFSDFVVDLGSILALIKTKAKKTFLPIGISASPINPTKDFIVVFRNKENVRSIPLDGWYTDDIAKLSTKFASETMKVTGKKSDVVKIELDALLMKLNKEKGLNIIGGFMDTANK